jgi:DMSO/TMAO reductase YedYZ molybdopterin-dependent catalytic subunit
MKKHSLLLGALVGGLLTAPLLAIIFVGHQVFRLPFLPSDFFNPVRDFTPGDIIVSTIQVMVDVIIALNLGRVDEVAKPIEIAMAIGMVFAVGVISGIIFFAIFNRIERRIVRIGGIIGGLLVGLGMAFISLQFGVTSEVEPRVIGGMWLFALFLVWGIAHAFVYERLSANAEAKAGSAEALNRRQFLVTVGTTSATLTVVGAGLGALLSPRFATTEPVQTAAAGTETVAGALPNANDPVIPAPGTRSEITPVEDHYRIDIATIPPRILEEDWTLPFVSNLSGSEVALASFTLEQIKAYESREDYITMSCISNRIAGDLISTTKWTGVSFRTLLADAALPPEATHLKIFAADGFDEIVALDTIMNDERVMLAYYWEDKPLTTEHGFPIRIHIPDLYGMKQPKWINKIEVLAADEDGYWVRRGWDKVARVRATAVIDTVAVDMMIVDDNENQRIPIGGIAWAGARGIAGVEVRVDGGEWQAAQLRSAVSDRTWNIWRYDWAFAEGDHTFEVRCVEADGTPQIEEQASVRPSGATGIHSMGVMI